MHDCFLIDSELSEGKKNIHNLDKRILSLNQGHANNTIGKSVTHNVMLYTSTSVFHIAIHKNID